MVELSGKSDRMFREFLTPIVSLIVKYLTKNVKNKKLRDVDPTILTAAIAASIVAHNGVLNVLDGEAADFSNSKQAITAYIDFWLAILT
jgi:hypothetical protein